MLEGAPLCGTSSCDAGWSQVSSKLQWEVQYLSKPSWPEGDVGPISSAWLGAQAPATILVLLPGQRGGCGQGPRAPMALDSLDWYKSRGLSGVLEPLESLGTVFQVRTAAMNSCGTRVPCLTGHPFPQVRTRDSDLFIPGAVSEGHGCRNLSVLPATAKPSQAWNAPAPCSAPGPSFLLAPDRE